MKNVIYKISNEKLEENFWALGVIRNATRGIDKGKVDRKKWLVLWPFLKRGIDFLDEFLAPNIEK